MSVGPLSSLAANAAGAPLAQTKGSDIDQAQLETSNQQRQVRNDTKAEDAAGIGQTDGEDHEAAERDADGRRIWENLPGRGSRHEEHSDAHQRPSKDASGQSGNLLDLSG